MHVLKMFQMSEVLLANIGDKVSEPVNVNNFTSDIAFFQQWFRKNNLFPILNTFTKVAGNLSFA